LPPTEKSSPITRGLHSVTENPTQIVNFSDCSTKKHKEKRNNEIKKQGGERKEKLEKREKKKKCKVEGGTQEGNK
jgi:hypothetical protein